MKNHISPNRIALMACGISSLLSAMTLQGADSFIKQWETPPGGEPEVVSTIYFNGPSNNATKTGQNTSEKKLVNENSPFYELWTAGIASDKDTMYMVDTASSGPETHISMVSGDYLVSGAASGTTYSPFEPLRTRADQPFGVLIQSQLVANAADSEAGDISMQKVYYRHTTKISGGAGEDFQQDHIFSMSDLHNEPNASNVLIRMAGVSQLPIEDEINFKQRGEDIFRIYALNNNNDAVFHLAEEKIQIWPIAQGAIELVGYAPYDTITRSLPNIKITLTDLYPYSSTYALIYKGTKEVPLLDGFPPRVIEISRRSVPMDNLVPQSQEFTIAADDWKSYVPDDCEYTIEIITHTPFEGLDYPAIDPEVPIALAEDQDAQILPLVDGRSSALILASDEMPTSGGLSLFYTSFTVDRTISVKANVITSE